MYRKVDYTAQHKIRHIVWGMLPVHTRTLFQEVSKFEAKVLIHTDKKYAERIRKHLAEIRSLLFSEGVAAYRKPSVKFPELEDFKYTQKQASNKADKGENKE